MSAFGKKTAAAGLSLGGFGNVLGQVSGIASAVAPLLSSNKAKGVIDALAIGSTLFSGGGKATGKGSAPKAGLPAVIGALPRILPSLGIGGGGSALPSIAGGVAGGVIGDFVGDIFAGGGAGVACPSGYHPAKDGSGRCVRNRRMNPLNPRAFRRALRRMKGAKRFAREVDRAFPRARRSAPRRRSGSHSH